MHRSLSTLVAAACFAAAAPAYAAPAAVDHVIYGIVTSVGTDAIVIKRRDGRLLNVDIGAAKAAETTGVLYVKRPVAITGAFDATGRYRAESIRTWYGLLHDAWPAER